MLFKTTNEITVYLMLKHTQNFQDSCYPIEIINFSRLGRALKILVSAVRFCLWPPLPWFDCIHFILLRVTVLKILNDKDTRRTRFFALRNFRLPQISGVTKPTTEPHRVPTPQFQNGIPTYRLYSLTCMNNNKDMKNYS